MGLLLASGLVGGCDTEPRLASACELRVVGQAPSYVDTAVSTDALPADVCRGVWVPGVEDGFVPQGVAVRGDRAFVGGWRGPRIGQRHCRVEVISLRSGRLLAGPRSVPGCYHGGGLMLDEHGLWVTSSARVWLLDPATLRAERSWDLVQPVQGSFGLLDGGGRIGLGRFRGDVTQLHRHPGPARIDWFDLDDVLGLDALSTADAVASRPIGRSAQGAVWGLEGPGTWVARSTTRCGILETPQGRELHFVPGAEGMDRVGDHLWVVSESAAREYFTAGERPAVPSLVRVDLRRLDQWPDATCSVS